MRLYCAMNYHLVRDIIILVIMIKLIETSGFHQNVHNQILSIFISTNFFLKCFLNWLIGQLVILMAILIKINILPPNIMITPPLLAPSLAKLTSNNYSTPYWTNLGWLHNSQYWQKNPKRPRPFPYMCTFIWVKYKLLILLIGRS